MNTSKLPVRALMLMFVLFAVLPLRAAPLDPGWPREIVRDDATLIYYQPQIDDWKGFQGTERSNGD